MSDRIIKVIHIAGLPLVIGGTKGRQLCAWCGERLIDDDYASIMVAERQVAEALLEGTSDAAPKFYKVNALVAVEGTNPRLTSVVQPDEDGKMPAGCCALDFPKLRAVP